MKTCPVCHASTFDDAKVCYGCMHRFGEDEEPQGRVGGNGMPSLRDAPSEKDPAPALPLAEPPTAARPDWMQREMGRLPGEPHAVNSPLAQRPDSELLSPRRGSAAQAAESKGPAEQSSVERIATEHPSPACSGPERTAERATKPRPAAMCSGPVRTVEHATEPRPAMTSFVESHEDNRSTPRETEAPVSPCAFSIAFEPVMDASGAVSWRCTITPGVYPRAASAVLLPDSSPRAWEGGDGRNANGAAALSNLCQQTWDVDAGWDVDVRHAQAV